MRRPQAFAGVGVVGTNFHARQLREWNFFRGIVEEYERERVSGILCADQMRQCHRYFLRGREAVLAIEDHRMRAVEHEHRRTRRLVLALVDLQVAVFDVQRQFEPFALDCIRKRGRDVEVERVAELVGLRRSAGFYARGHVARVVTAKARLAERSQQVAQRFESQKIEALVGDLEAGLLLAFANLSADARILCRIVGLID